MPHDDTIPAPEWESDAPPRTDVTMPVSTPARVPVGESLQAALKPARLPGASAQPRISSLVALPTTFGNVKRSFPLGVVVGALVGVILTLATVVFASSSAAEQDAPAAVEPPATPRQTNLQFVAPEDEPTPAPVAEEVEEVAPTKTASVAARARRTRQTRGAAEATSDATETREFGFYVPPGVEVAEAPVADRLPRSPSTGARGRRSNAALDAAAVRAVIQRQYPRLRQCYDRELRRLGSGVSQRVQLNVRVAPNGEVRRVRARNATLGRLGACLERVARGWEFPASRSGGEVPVPIRFDARE